MVCPQCKAEYRAGFTRCSDCDTDLVDHLPPIQDAIEGEHAEDSGYVLIATAQGPFEEGPIRSFLESNGIPTEVRGEAVSRVYGITLDGLGAKQILVPKEFAESAAELLATADHGDFAIDSTDVDTAAQPE